MSFKRVLAAASVAASLLAAPAMAAQTVGSEDGGGCYPFACNDGAESFNYFQIYSADAFAGAITFDTISFFGFLTDLLPAPAILAGDYEISFGTTTDAVGTTSLPTIENEAVFFSGAFAGGGLSFAGTAYAYDPTKGNLVLRASISGQAPTANDPGVVGSLAADYTAAAVSRGGQVVFSGVGEDLSAEGALVTSFSNSVVPEPATWGLMIVGFGATGALLRSRRRVAVRAA